MGSKKGGKKKNAAGGAAEAGQAGASENTTAAENSLDTAAAAGISSEASGMTPGTANTNSKENGFMTLTLKGLDKRGRNAIYTGAAVSLRMPIGAFPEKTPPQTIEVPDGVLAGPKTPRAKMTPEERKAARAAAPKLTLAEKVAKAEERAAKLREKLAKAPAAAEQPSL